MNVISLGLRNLRRNFRRSLTTALSIAFGFAAVALFCGYTKMVYLGLTEQAVHGELIGHLTLAKRGMKQEGRLHPERYLLRPEEIAKLSAIVREHYPEAHIAPRLALSGLVSNGRVSTIFLADGIGADDMKTLRGPRRNEAGGLAADAPQGIAMARGLAELLGLKNGDDASLLVSTLHGQANAGDASILATFTTGNAGMEDKALHVPLAMAQSLYDATDRADRLTVLLPDIAQTEIARDQLAAAFAAAGLDVEISTWQELSAFYRQVKGMFDMIFSFILSIVLTIVVMSVTNAMSMSVIERTREIGTLRAIGLRRAGVVKRFVVEALLLVGIGCLAGLGLALLVRAGVNAGDITYTPPNGTGKVQLLVGFDARKMALTFVLLSALALVAAFLPARRAARQPVIESLAHV
ncbi:MAG: ABC transporter permease [Betaproteobacteria bacterium]